MCSYKCKVVWLHLYNYKCRLTCVYMSEGLCVYILSACAGGELLHCMCTTCRWPERYIYSTSGGQWFFGNLRHPNQVQSILNVLTETRSSVNALHYVDGYNRIWSTDIVRYRASMHIYCSEPSRIQSSDHSTTQHTRACIGWNHSQATACVCGGSYE